MADKLKFSLKKLPDWAIGVAKRENWYIDTDETIQGYIEGKADTTDALIMLEDINFADIAKSLLEAYEGNISIAQQTMKQGVYRRSISNILDVMSGRKYQLSNQIVLDDVCHIAFLLLTNGLPDQAKRFYLFMMDELANGNMIVNGKTTFTLETLRYSSMGMTILNDWLDLPPPDLEKLFLPQDPDWMHYAHNWRGPDQNKFIELLNQICDVHIERIGIKQKEYNLPEYEFCSPFQALYPVEILGVLRLRELLGIQNPPLTHPLLLTPYAEITSFASEDELPEDLLLDDYLNALRKNDPELIEAWDNFVIQ